MKIARFFMTIHGKQMLSLLQRPSEWSRDRDDNPLMRKTYVITHEPSGLSVWAANEAYGISMYANGDSLNIFNFWDRVALWPWVKLIAGKPDQIAVDNVRLKIAIACEAAGREEAQKVGT